MVDNEEHLHAVRETDDKGRISLPFRIRDHKKYLILTKGDDIILRGVT